MSTKRKAEILLFVDVSHERFVLNATSMLDQTNASSSISDNFVAGQMNRFTFLSKESKGYAIYFFKKRTFSATEFLV